MTSLSTAFKHMLNQGFRACVLVEGDRQWRLNVIEKIISEHPSQINRLAFHYFENSQYRAEKTQTFQQLLGQEFSFVWIDAEYGINPDQVCALTGTIKAGGLLILSFEKFEQDADLNRFLPWSASEKYTADTISLFNKRLTAHSDAIVLKASSQAHSGLTSIIDKLAETLLKRAQPINSNIPLSATGITVKKKTEWQTPKQLTDDQIDIAQQISQYHKGHFVITADRGRGKSVTLAAVANQILMKQAPEQQIKIAITAPAKKNVSICLAWLKILSKDDHNVTFYAPDALIAMEQSFDYLLIDEAAAIPLALLKSLSQCAEHITYTTTLHGYEGSGSSFNLKFLDFLTATFNDLTSFNLTHPIRWAAQDPLEKWLNQSYLLKLNTSDLSNAKHQNHDQLCIKSSYKSDNKMSDAAEKITTQWFTGNALINNENILIQIFDLLKAAHYRTTPSDLRYMLDSPAMKIAVTLNIKQNTHACVIAVALISKEGGLPTDLTQDVAAGKRRPNGHLIPQTVAAHMGNCEFAQLLGWRIVRIAVKPHLQSQNLGSELLTWIQTQAQSEKIDYLGASFSATEQVMNFWRNNRFNLIRTGMSLETTTACFPAVMIRFMSKNSQFFSATLSQNSLMQLNYRLTTHYNKVDPALLWQWFASITQTAFLNKDSHAALIQNIAHSKADIYAAQAELSLFCQQNATLILNHLPRTDCALLAQFLWQQQNIKTLSKSYQLAGKKALVSYIRKLFADILQILDKDL